MDEDSVRPPARLRIRLRVPAASRRALSAERTDPTTRIARQTDELSQVHERGEKIPGTRIGVEGVDACEHGAPVRGVACGAVQKEDPRQHSGHVGFGGRRPLAVRECRDRRGRVGPEAGELLELARIRRQATPVRLHEASRRAPEIAGARVVTQPRPGREHRLFARPRERVDVGEPSEELPVTRPDRGDCGLLEHHLRDPDAIRIPGSTPGELPLLAGEPAKEVRPNLAISRSRDLVTGSGH